MRKPVSLFLIAIALAMPIFGNAADTIYRNVKIEFGYTLNPDGTKRPLRGITLPITLKRIKADLASRQQTQKSLADLALRNTAFGRVVGRLEKDPLLGGGGQRNNILASDVYVSDNAAAYYIQDPTQFADPSSLDGMVMNAGASRPWETMAWGFHAEFANTRTVFRFRCYSTYNPGAAAGTSAFTNEFADFGFNLDNIPAGTWKVDPPIPVTNLGITSTNNGLWMANQYRVPHNGANGLEDGEGAFDTNFYIVYSAVAPSVGSSEDNFWYDWDPLNGIYANEEFDILGDGSGNTFPSNFLFRIGAGNLNQETIVPFSVTFPTGSGMTGNFLSLWYSDDSYVTIKRGITLNPSIDPMQVEVQGLASTGNVVSLKLSYEIASTTSGAPVKVLLWNFVTNTYDQVATHTTTATDATYEYLVQSQPSRYINQSDHTVKAKITFRAVPSLNSNWNCRIDKVNWIITK